MPGSVHEGVALQRKRRSDRKKKKHSGRRSNLIFGEEGRAALRDAAEEGTGPGKWTIRKEGVRAAKEKEGAAGSN